MKKTEIKIGKPYRLNHHSSKGAAVVTGPAGSKKMNSWDRKNTTFFPVKYPDSLDAEGNPETDEIAAKEFLRQWNEYDDQLFQDNMRAAVRRKEIAKLLETAGYAPMHVGLLHDDELRITFSGVTAEQVIARLTDG